MSDWADDPTAKVWLRHVMDDMVPKLAGSAVAISMVPDSIGDAKYWVELGASIMMDKPLLVLVMGDRALPEKLQAVADEIVRLPHGVDPAGSEALVAALERMMDRP